MGHRSVVQWGHGSVEITRVSCTMDHGSAVQWVTGSVVQWITVQLYNGSQVSGNDPGQLHNGSWVSCTMGHSLTGQLYNGSGVSGNDPLSRVTTKCYQYCKDQHRIRNCKAKLSLQSLGVQLPMDGLAIRFVSRFSTSKNVFWSTEVKSKAEMLKYTIRPNSWARDSDKMGFTVSISITGYLHRD